MNQEIIARGQNAKRVLDMPEFKATIEEVRKELFDQFRKTNVADSEQREDLHKIMYACDLFVSRLQKYVEAGEFEVNSSQQQEDA
ncbi:hypothetical protein J2Y48_002503 [Mycoplana sp. BE70]|uniref:hypothetical protein n=1 Tax=Mycoplana sp. BE70 TaxID=2817775 RepID=UPI0028652AD4|nr:hypothetical protein [Mycoplana sp. BE70]MDR6757207.1 hypothetical protein [Mycoplana sp. BE70]